MPGVKNGDAHNRSSSEMENLTGRNKKGKNQAEGSPLNDRINNPGAAGAKTLLKNGVAKQFRKSNRLRIWSVLTLTSW